MSRKMKLAAWWLILICCNAWAIKIAYDNLLVKSIYKTKIEDLLEKLKSILRNGDRSLGLPVLNPLIVHRVPIKLNDANLNIEAYLPYVKLDGLSSYNVNSADFKLLGMRLDMHLMWPLVVATANYSMKGNAFGIEVFYGNGKVDVAAHDFHFKTQINLELKRSSVQIKNMSTKISLKALDLYVTGLYNNEKLSEIFSKMISNKVPKLIDKSQKMIVDKVNYIIMDKLNKFLSTKTLKDLLFLVLA